MNPTFLTVAQVIRMQTRQLARYGGLAGIRDRNLLESAVAQPMATFGGQFLHEDLHLMGTAYVFHLVKNHPFLDANKRAGLVAGLLFLRINGVVIADPGEILYDTTIAVAEGTMNKADLAEVLRRLTVPHS